MEINQELSIIILTWNSDDYINDCIEHLAIPSDFRCEIVIVDNGSKTYQQENLSKKFPHLNIIELPQAENLGFAKGCNIGAAHARGEWLAFLNADAFPKSDWLEKFIYYRDQYPKAGGFGSLVIQNKDPGFVDSAGDIYNISGVAWKGYGGYPLEVVPKNPYKIFSPSAAAAFYRRDIFLEIGEFDAEFFSYFEDVDLGFRLNLFGYECIYMPGALVQHVGSSSTGVDSDFALYHYHRNMVWSYVKNMPGLLFWLYLPMHLFANLIFYLKYLKNKRGNVVWKAKIDAIRGLSKAWEARQTIQKKRRAGIVKINKLLDKHILLPYLIGYKLRRYKKEFALATKEIDFHG